MIYRFTTTVQFSGVNVMLGLLTPAPAAKCEHPQIISYEPRGYVQGICDWCGTRELVDVEDNLYSGLNWVTRHQRKQQFCSRKCRAALEADGEQRGWPDD